MPQNTTPTKLNSLKNQQKLQKLLRQKYIRNFVNLEEKYIEKEADKKMEGNQ